MLKCYTISTKLNYENILLPNIFSLLNENNVIVQNKLILICHAEVYC